MQAAQYDDRVVVRGMGSFAKISTYWFSLNFMWGGLNSIIVPALVVYFLGDSLKGTAVGLVLASGFIVSMFVQPAAGAVSDSTASRLGRRRPFILTGSLLAVPFLLLIGISDSYVWLFIGYVLLQIASNLAQGPFEGLIPDLVAGNERGRAAGFAGIAIITGTSAGVLVSGYLMGRDAVLLAVICISVVVILGMLVTVLLVPESTVPRKKRASVLAAVRSAFDKDVFKYKDFVWLLVSRFFVLAGVYSVRDFALYFVRDVLKMENAAWVTATLMAVVAMSSVVTVLVAGIVSDRVGRKKIVLFTCAVGVVAAFAFFSSTDYVVTLAFGVVVGVGFGSFLSVDWAFATDLIPKSQAGRFMGLSNVATAGADAFALIVGGPLLDFFNSRGPNLGYQALMYLVVAYFVLAALSLLKVREHVVQD